jgi:polyisoprenoid-binding protein YceI
MSTWNLDQAHSLIGFKVKHLMVSTVRGSFTDFTGSVTSADDAFENAQVTFTAQSASVHTHNEARDGHLKSPDFFDVAQFSTLSFTSKSFVKKDAEAFSVTGDMMMHGVTKEVTFVATLNGIAPGLSGKRVVSFDISGTLDRRDFGMALAMPMETGGLVVSNDVVLDIQVEAVEA